MTYSGGFLLLFSSQSVCYNRCGSLVLTGTTLCQRKSFPIGSAGQRSYLPSLEKLFLGVTLIVLRTYGFSDASQNGFAAGVYLRTLYDDSSVSLALAIAAKTKVALVKRETIPRLELSGALLLAKLLENVRTALGLQLYQLYAWNDSSIILSWLDGSPRRLQTYVANRVGQILKLLPSTAWRHVPTDSNPADCASRGMLHNELLQHKLWWDTILLSGSLNIQTTQPPLS